MPNGRSSGKRTVFSCKEEQLALEMMTHARKNRLHDGCAGTESGYGKEPGLCLELGQMEGRFVVDPHMVFPVYLENQLLILKHQIKVKEEPCISASAAQISEEHPSCRRLRPHTLRSSFQSLLQGR